MMKIKHYFKFFVASAILFQAENILAQHAINDYLKISPFPLQAGSALSVKLDPVKSKLNIPDEPVKAIFVVLSGGKENVWDITMDPTTDGSLQASFQIPDSSNALAIKFVQRNRQVNNDGHGFIFTLGDTAKGTNAQVWQALSLLYRGYALAGVTKPNRDLSQYYLDRYYETVGIDKLGFVDKTLALYLRGDTSALRNHLHSVETNREITENEILNVAYYARTCGQQTVDLLDAFMQKRFPGGRNAWMKATDSIRQKIPNEQKLAWIERFARSGKSFDDLKFNSTDELYRYLHYQAAGAMDTTVMWACESKITRRIDQAKSIHDAYILFAEQAVERNIMNSTATNLALQGMAFYEGQLRAFEFSTNNKNRYRDVEFCKDQYLKAANIYGSLLLLQGRNESAMQYAGIAAKYFEYASVQFNDPFFTSAESLVPHDSLYNWLLTAFQREAYNENIKRIFVRTAKAIGRPDASQTLARIVQPRINALKETLRPKMLNTPATEFTLQRISGGKVSLSSLKGQVVVLDFWATWCGPCIASFPLMQQLVDANAVTKEAAVFFVNTWQNEKNKTDVVKEFFTKHPYRFDVLMDADNKVVEAFNIKGIPTKIFIDKNGIIRFISVGFYSEKEKSIEELQAMISLTAEASL